jgi:hypothetical protein
MITANVVFCYPHLRGDVVVTIAVTHKREWISSVALLYFRKETGCDHRDM